MNILETIVASKVKEVEERQAKTSVSALEKSSLFNREILSLRQSILDPAKTGIIAEFKRRSPSKGIINDRSSGMDVTGGYVEGGASGLSILTDTNYFGGYNEDLLAAREHRIPILRKDFIIDEYQVVEARSMGADAILLIASSLSPVRVRELAKFANELRLEVLLELHEEEELEHINEFTKLVGVNNRNLKTFEVDMDKSIRMAEKIGTSRVRIAESGIGSVEDILSFRKFGFDGFLIGEYFMKQHDPAAAFSAFTKKLRTT
jgi:indole-3-glycerol phosphate synthase